MICGGCAKQAWPVFVLPGAWEGALCGACCAADPGTKAAFEEHFGTVVLVADGDAGKSRMNS